MKKQKQEREENNFKFKRPKLGLSPETKRGMAAVLFAALAVISFLSIVKLAGGFGQGMLGGLKWLFGLLAFFVPVFLLLVVWLLLKQPLQEKDEEGKEVDSGFYWRVYLGSFLLVGSIDGIIHLLFIKSGNLNWDLVSQGRGGGFLGAIFGGSVFNIMDFWAGMVLMFALLVVSLLIAFNVALKKLLPWKKTQNVQPETIVKINSMSSEGFSQNKVLNKNKKISEGEEDKNEKEEVRPKLEQKIIHPGMQNKNVEIDMVKVDNRINYKLPDFDLLTAGEMKVDSGNIELNMQIIKKTLADFGIVVEMGEVNVGPTVAQYTLRPAIGVKLSQIAALSDNLALELAAKSIRMELPIPGKALVGIEVPNKTTSIVCLRDVLYTNEFIKHGSRLAFALGRDVAGKPMITDLESMPHLLIAGSTGTGKSVGINSLLVSLLYKNSPQEVKFVIIDPKRVELGLYNGIPHLLTPVITDHEKAVNALKWAVSEMERRFKLLSASHFRNIIEYNQATELKLPYLVVVVDELADLMAVAQGDVEGAIVRLAQLGRGAGIHLVLATQYPNADIVTGLIKANITTRMVFKVASQVNSRVVIDKAGAEKLLGKGDMLFVSSESVNPKRIQGSYVSGPEVQKVVEFFKNQAGAVIYDESIVEKPKKTIGVTGFEDGQEENDPLFEEAKELVQKSGKASTTFLQRNLGLGYARAARIMDQLERAQIVGPGEGAKPREVYGFISSKEKAEYGVEDDVQNS